MRSKCLVVENKITNSRIPNDEILAPTLQERFLNYDNEQIFFLYSQIMLYLLCIVYFCMMAKTTLNLTGLKYFQAD